MRCTVLVARERFDLTDESLIVSHHQLRFELSHGIDGDTNNDEQRRAGQQQSLNTGNLSRNIRENRDDAEEQRADQRNPRHDASQVSVRVRAGTNSRNERALLLQVLGDALLLEHHHRIEIGERHDHEEVDHLVLKRVRIEEASHVFSKVPNPCPF